jgi:hypothetical protein
MECLKIRNINQILRNFFSYFNIYINRINKKKHNLIKLFFKKIFIIDSGYELVRIGNNSDGGYLVPKVLNKINYCFSAGVGYNTSFEDDLLNYDIKSFLLDGTVNYKGPHNFIKKNLGHLNDINTTTLKKWINSKNLKRTSKLMLKLDIEGSEVEVISQVENNILNKFNIIIIEFHHFKDLTSEIGINIYSHIFDKILRNHLIVHMHSNNSNYQLINNKKITYGIEFTFINKKIIKKKAKIKHSLPHILDRKCEEKMSEVKIPEIFYK